MRRNRRVTISTLDTVTDWMRNETVHRVAIKWRDPLNDGPRKVGALGTPCMMIAWATGDVITRPLTQAETIENAARLIRRERRRLERERVTHELRLVLARQAGLLPPPTR